MPDQVITCPYCQKEIPLSEAISHQIKEKLQKEFEDQSKKIEKEAKQKAEDAVVLELKDLREQLEEQVKKNAEISKS